MPLKFFCKSKVDDEKQFETRRFAQLTETSPFLQDFPFFYSAFINFDDNKEENSTLFITGRGVVPHVKLSQTLLDFFDCPMNEKRDILINIENQNQEVSIDYQFEKVPFL